MTKAGFSRLLKRMQDDFKGECTPCYSSNCVHKNGTKCDRVHGHILIIFSDKTTWEIMLSEHTLLRVRKMISKVSHKDDFKNIIKVEINND